MVVLLIEPEPLVLSSGEEIVPETVTNEELLIVPCPAADMVPAIVPLTVTLLYVPVLMLPVDVTELIVVLLIEPEPLVLSSGEEIVPETVPNDELLIVPCPAADIVPAIVPLTVTLL